MSKNGVVWSSQGGSLITGYSSIRQSACELILCIFNQVAARRGAAARSAPDSTQLYVRRAVARLIIQHPFGRWRPLSRFLHVAFVFGHEMPSVDVFAPNSFIRLAYLMSRCLFYRRLNDCIAFVHNKKPHRRSLGEGVITGEWRTYNF